LLLGSKVTFYLIDKGKDNGRRSDDVGHVMAFASGNYQPGGGCGARGSCSKNFTRSVDLVSTIHRYKDTYKDDISVRPENGVLPPPNTVQLNRFDSGVSLMSFAEIQIGIGSSRTCIAYEELHFWGILLSIIRIPSKRNRIHKIHQLWHSVCKAAWTQGKV
jgi:hypothetical protein